MQKANLEFGKLGALIFTSSVEYQRCSLGRHPEIGCDAGDCQNLLHKEEHADAR